MLNKKSASLGKMILSLLVCITLLVNAVPFVGATAEGTGSGSVKFYYQNGDLPIDVSIAVTVYKIGNVNPGNRYGWDLDTAFEKYTDTLFETPSEEQVKIIANAIIDSKDIGSAEKHTQTLGADGQTTFKLSNGVYLYSVEATWKGASLGDILQFPVYIFTMPYVKEENGVKTVYTDYPGEGISLKGKISATEVSGTKTWEDSNNQDGIRPPSITVNLFADGEPVNSATVTPDADGAWKYTFGGLQRFKAGNEIVYTVTEDEVDGYNTEIDGYDITNKHEPETTQVSVTKTWEDGNNQDGIRPGSITVNLLADGEKVDSATISANADDKWEYTFDGLPLKKDGVIIDYTITEDGVSGYQTQIDGYSITNTHTPEETEVTVTKTWVDEDDQDGIRPGSITVNLLADGEKVDSATISANADDKWEYTFDGLPLKKDGEIIDYTITEDGVSGYQTQINGYDITNTHEPETVNVSVTKVWNDADNADGLRPASLTVTLSNGQSVTLNEDNSWTATIEGLPRYENGEEITYTWSEPSVNGYESASSVSGTSTVFTNTHEPETVDVSVTKVWEDMNDLDGLRPDSLTVTLSNGQSVTLSAANGWSATITDLPKYNADGSEIAYTWTEAGINGYTLTGNTTNGTVTTLTNTHEPETTEATVRKVWDDGDNADGIRPASLVVTLSNGQSVTLSAANGWSATVTGLPRYSGNREIVYTWTEAGVTGYTLTSSTTNGTVTTLTNFHEPTPTVDVPVTKIWEDNNNEHNVRPASITVTLYRNGAAIGTATLTAGSWSYTFTDLPAVDESGNPISYTVSEVPVQFYTSAVNGTTIINTLIPREPENYTSISGDKVWEDNNNADGLRPNYITVTLYRDGVAVDSRPVSVGTNWSYVFDNLPADDGYGHIYNYTVRESGVTGYFSRVNGTTLINTRLPSPPTDNVPGTPTRNTPTPPFETFTEEDLEDLLDLSDYGTPLFGQLLGTGDDTPAYPFIFGGIGVLAIILLLVFGRKRRKNEVK